MAERINLMSTESATARWKRFLETTPPNTPTKIAELVETPAMIRISEAEGVISSPTIFLHCERDGGTRRFTALGQTPVVTGHNHKFVTYKCRDCGTTQRTFALVLDWQPTDGTSASTAEVMKMGEFPPFSTPVSRPIKKLLTDSDLELYRKGNRAIDQGLGIGAASYFRRIVESQWKLLVKELRKAAGQLGGNDLGAYDKALRSNQFATAVDSLKDAIPAKLLLPGNLNPLTLLHRSLSKQLHQLTDEECLEQAEAIRVVLTALLDNIATVLEDERQLTAAANTLQEI